MLAKKLRRVCQGAADGLPEELARSAHPRWPDYWAGGLRLAAVAASVCTATPTPTQADSLRSPN